MGPSAGKPAPEQCVSSARTNREADHDRQDRQRRKSPLSRCGRTAPSLPRPGLRRRLPGERRRLASAGLRGRRHAPVPARDLCATGCGTPAFAPVHGHRRRGARFRADVRPCAARPRHPRFVDDGAAEHAGFLLCAGAEARAGDRAGRNRPRSQSGALETAGADRCEGALVARGPGHVHLPAGRPSRTAERKDGPGGAAARVEPAGRHRRPAGDRGPGPRGRRPRGGRRRGVRAPPGHRRRGLGRRLVRLLDLQGLRAAHGRALRPRRRPGRTARPQPRFHPAQRPALPVRARRRQPRGLRGPARAGRLFEAAGRCRA